MLALRRTRLSYGVIHADVFALGIKLAESLLKSSRAESRGDLFQIGHSLGKMFAQGMRQGLRAPDEHAAVPVVMARIQKFLGALGVGLFRKAPHAQDTAPGALAGLNVAVTGLGAGRLDAHYHHVVAL